MQNKPAAGPHKTEPRPVASHELPNWPCPQPDCWEHAASGTTYLEDRGPFQLLLWHELQCPNGHRWNNSTDGG